MSEPDKTPQRLQPSDPEWDRLAREVNEAAFVREGAFAAFPLCFPGVTLPIPREESRIRFLTTDAEGMVYGSTTGRANHVFFGCFQGNTGIVLDLKWPDPSAECVAIACGLKQVLFAANPAGGGGRLYRRKVQHRPGDLLHEWSFRNHPFEEVEIDLGGEAVIGMALAAERDQAVLATRSGIYHYSFSEDRIVKKLSTSVAGGLGVVGKAVVGFNDNGCLWRYRTDTRELEQTGTGPHEGFVPGESRWAGDRMGRRACLITGDGRVYRLDDAGRLADWAGIRITPVTAAALTPDGRLMSFAGEGIAHFHIHGVDGQSVRDHGAAVSVLERRRYGYAFASAAVGQSGEIYFGEDDDQGHLWIYFPSIPEG